MERAMKVQEVMLQAMAKKITWWQAAEILGISDRHMRRWRERYEEEGYNGLFDRRRGKPSRRRVPVATVERVFALVSGKVFRSERAAFSREVAGRARDRIELHLGEAGAAGSGPGGARTQARGASQTAGAAAVAGDAVAYRRQPAPVVSGRALVRPDRDSGRCHQRDLLRPAGGGGIDGDGDGGAEGSDRAQRRVLRVVQRSGQPFLADAEGGRQGRLPSPHASGAGVARVGSADDPGLLAASARPQRTQLLAPGRDACRRSCGCASWRRWRRRTGFCGKTTWPSSIAVFRSRPGSGAMLLCPAGTATWNAFSRCSSNAA